ncbi:MAG: RIP metalloprotease [Acidimicrobiia bacterium]
MTDPTPTPAWPPPEPGSAERTPLGTTPPFVPGTPVTSWVRLAMVIAVCVALALFSPWVFVAVMAIAFMIFMHELGHFLTARAAGMKVTEFFIGFGPRIWSFRKGEVEYGLKAIPAGAYVRIIGMSNLEQVDPADEARTYRQKPYWRRLSVAVAGSTMHFILALVCLLGLFVGYGKQSEDRWFVGEVVAGSAAQIAGFELGDRIQSIDGNQLSTFAEMRPYLQTNAGKQVTVVVLRDGQPVTLTPTIGSRVDPTTGATTGFLGVGAEYERVRESVPAAVVDSFRTFGVGTWETIKGIGGIFTPAGVERITDSFKTQKPVNGVAVGTPDTTNERPQSIIGIVRNSSDAAEAGLATFLGIYGSVNLAIGILNLLPTLPLDGGHVVIATYERLRSRKGKRYYADVTKMLPLAYLTVIVLVALGFVTMFLDVAKPVSLFP